MLDGFIRVFLLGKTTVVPAQVQDLQRHVTRVVSAM